MAEAWVLPTTAICLYGFFKDMKPSEPFLTPYLNSSYKNISLDDLNGHVYPVWTYGYLVFLFAVFLLTDFLRYKPLIIIESLSYLVTRILLIWGEGVAVMQVMQMTYGLATATEIAYYSYIYAMVDEEHFQRVSSYTRAVLLFSRSFSGILGQVLISTGVTNYLVLNYISFGAVLVAVFVSLFLPKVPGNVFLPVEKSGSYKEFDAPTGTPGSTQVSPANSHTELTRENTVKHQTCFSRWKSVVKLMYHSFKCSYKNKKLLMWSLWWAFAMCGCLQVENYVMNLWAEILEGEAKDVYNGGVFATGTLLSAVVAFLFSKVHADWGVIAEMLIGVISLVDGVVLFIMSSTHSVWLAYITYVVFRVTYTFVITVARYVQGNYHYLEFFKL